MSGWSSQEWVEKSAGHHISDSAGSQSWTREGRRKRRRTRSSLDRSTAKTSRSRMPREVDSDSEDPDESDIFRSRQRAERRRQKQQRHLQQQRSRPQPRAAATAKSARLDNLLRKMKTETTSRAAARPGNRSREMKTQPTSRAVARPDNRSREMKTQPTSRAVARPETPKIKTRMTDKSDTDADERAARAARAAAREAREVREARDPRLRPHRSHRNEAAYSSKAAGAQKATAAAHRRSPGATGTIADWVHEATFREKDRADVRAIMRTDSDHRVADRGLLIPSPDYMRGRRSSITSRDSKESDASQEPLSFDEDAVGPVQAGNPDERMDRHFCDLPPASEDEPFLPMPPHPSCAQKFQRTMLPLLMLSTKSTYTHHIVRSLTTMRDEQKRHAHSRHWYIIHPLSWLHFVWKPVVAILILTSLILTPVKLAFFLDAGVPYGDIRESLEKRNKSWHDPCDYYLLFVDFICLVDCVLKFFTGYYVAHENTTVLHPRLVARRYLRSFFIVDVIHALPLDYLFIWMPESRTNGLETWFKLLRLLRLRVLLIYINAFLLMLGQSSAMRSGVQVILASILFLHWISLAHWFLPFAVYGPESYIRTQKPGNMSWYVVSSLMDNPLEIKYLHCVYRGLKLALRITITHDPPQTGVDDFMVGLTIISGTILYVCLLIYSIFIFMIKESNYILYEQVMILVREYADFRNLSQDLKEKLFLFYDFSLERSFFRENVIRDNLSRHLLSQVQQHTYRESVRASRLFTGLPRAVCTAVAARVSPIVLLRGDVFLRHGDEMDSMYFVHYGALALVTFTGVESEHVKDGGHFGEIEMLHPQWRSTSTVLALETTVVLRLERRHFQRIFHAYVPLLFRLQQRAEMRLERLRAAAISPALTASSSASASASHSQGHSPSYDSYVVSD